MISEVVAEVITGVWALVFLGSFGAFAGALLYYNERRWPRFTSTMFDSAWVTAVMALFYGYQYFDGDTNYRWIAYALTCPFLVRTIHTYFTCPSKKCTHGGAYAGQWALYTAMGSIAVLMLFGYAITQVVSTGAQWTLYGTGFVLFGFAIGNLYRAIEYSPAEVPNAGWAYFAVVLIGLGWLVFPVILPLSPVMTGFITFFDSVFAYAIGDLVAKVCASWYFGMAIRRQCGRCVPRAPRCEPHKVVACTKPTCHHPAYTTTYATPAVCEVHARPNCPVCLVPHAEYGREAARAYYDDYEAQPFFLAHQQLLHQQQQLQHGQHQHHAARTTATTTVLAADQYQEAEVDDDTPDWMRQRQQAMQNGRNQHARSSPGYYSANTSIV